MFTVVWKETETSNEKAQSFDFYEDAVDFWRFLKGRNFIMLNTYSE